MCDKTRILLAIIDHVRCLKNDFQQNVLEVGNEKTASVKLWLESAKNQLQINFADLMENINAEKSKCCTCIICKR